MNQKQIFEDLRELNAAYELFLANYEGSEGSLNLFSLWLYNLNVGSTNNDSHESEQILANTEQGNMAGQISHVIQNINRLIKNYYKKMLDGSKLVSADDVHYLMRLMNLDSMRKTDLITMNLAEMPSGIEVIKRLIKNGLIEDFADPNDKRSKRVRITTEGKKELFGIMSQLKDINTIIASGMNGTQKFELLAGLTFMYNHHLRIYKNEKNSTLSDIKEKYAAKNL